MYELVRALQPTEMLGFLVIWALRCSAPMQFENGRGWRNLSTLKHSDSEYDAPGKIVPSCKKFGIEQSSGPDCPMNG